LKKFFYFLLFFNTLSIVHNKIYSAQLTIGTQSELESVDNNEEESDSEADAEAFYAQEYGEEDEEFFADLDSPPASGFSQISGHNNNQNEQVVPANPATGYQEVDINNPFLDYQNIEEEEEQMVPSYP
jgi:hypothetical protein